MFWFEIHPATYSYGMGYFDVTPGEMELFRQSIDANPARFERLANQIGRMKGLEIIGQEYARPKGNYEQPIQSWYNRKWVGVEARRDLEGDAFSPELPRILCAAFEKLMPLYDYLQQVHRAAAREGLTRTGEKSHG
jgi:uncharacterized protein (DUF2461 family)